MGERNGAIADELRALGHRVDHTIREHLGNVQRPSLEDVHSLVGKLLTSQIELETQFRELKKTAVTDISERRQAEEALRESQAFLQRVIDAVPESLSVIDRDYHVVLANRAARQLAEQPGELPNPLLCHQLLDQRKRRCSSPETPCPLKRIMYSKAPMVVTHTHRNSEGQPRYIELHAAPIFDASGNVAQIVELRRDLTPRKRAEEQRYQRLLEAVTSYTYSVAFDKRMPISTEHSPECLQTTGYTAEEYKSDRGLWLSMVHPDDRNLVLKQAEAACEGAATTPIEHRIRRKDGAIRWVKSTIVPHCDERGVVVRYDGVVEDITERKLTQIELETDLQIQQALKSILEISLQSIPLEKMLECVLETLFGVPFVALESKGAIFLADDRSESLVMKAQYGLSPKLLGLYHNVPYGSCLCGRAVIDRQIVFAQCLDERHDRGYPEMPPHGHYCVPIASDHHVLGVLNLYVREGHERKEVEELFLLSVASTLAGAIERRAAERSLKSTQVDLIAAEKIQQHLLPQSDPVLLGYEVHGTVVPAEFAAGDYFDYLAMADGSFGVVVGDVTGHGVGAGLLAASTQARIKTLTEMPLEIDEILSHVNRSLTQEIVEGVFITTILARIDLQSHTLSYVNAGHPSGYVITSDGTIKTALPSTAIPLAILPDAPFSLGGSVTLDPGDVAVFLTDGIPEARSRHDSFFGTERTAEVLRAACRKSAREMIDTLLAAVREFTGHAAQRDDMTAVVVKRLPD